MAIPLRRAAGVLVPLFSIRNDAGWGVGEFPDIARFATWMNRARLSLLALLPLNECGVGEESPYSALSAFALDPLYLSLQAIEDFEELGGESSLSKEDRERLDRARESETVAHPIIRQLKGAALLRCFRNFQESAASDGSARAKEFETFREEQKDWLGAYSLFRVLKEKHQHDWWKGWPAPLRDREQHAIDEAASRHRQACSFLEYIQWQAYGQIARARRAAREEGVYLIGDLPFTVAEDSADVWTRRGDFSLDATVGSPPDRYAAGGQDWGLPSYDWRACRENGFEWLRSRATHAGSVFDAARIDHVVGFYRTYVHPKDGTPSHFLPAEEEEQRLQGEAILETFRAGKMELIAEDLGTIPPFVRDSLRSLEVPGYRVLRWEKDGEQFRDPAGWPPHSMATTGTHDTETLASWWDGLTVTERRELLTLSSFSGLDEEESRRFSPRVHEVVMEAMYRSASRLLVFPIQDVFGFRDRINVPGTMGRENWSYRLPWTTDELLTSGKTIETTRTLANLALAHGRAGDG